MASILVRGLKDRIVRLLKERAARHDRSLQGEVKQILEQAAAAGSVADALADLRAHRGSLGRRFSDSAELLREDRAR